MRVVDLFAGWGGFSLGAEQAGAEILLAANHWPVAVQAHKANHPKARHLCQDLNQANFFDFPDMELLVAAPACIPFDQAVEMGDRTKKDAGSIGIGERVLTHTGKSLRVTNRWQKKFTGEMVSLTMWHDTKQTTDMTSDHKVYVRRKPYKGATTFNDPEFVDASELKNGDYVAFPLVDSVEGTAKSFVENHRKEESKVVINGNDEDTWWLLGHYLGDGESRNDRDEIGWSTGSSVENLDNVKRILKNMGLSSWERGLQTNRRVHCSSMHLSALCNTFGRLSYTKQIPPELITLEERFSRALINGYMAADGSKKKGKRGNMRRATTTSLLLAQGFQQLAWKLKLCSGICVGDYARKSTIEGRKVNCRDTWEIWIQEPHKQARAKFLDGMIWRGIRSVKKKSVTCLNVLDFEVEEDHTFCLPGMVVHNCQGHSQAAQPSRSENNTVKRHHDALRSTAWAVVSCADAKNPENILVENVLDFRRWRLYPAWRAALEALGYTLEEHVALASRFGVPQRRQRLIITAVKGKTPLKLKLPKAPEPAFGPCIDWSETRGWGSIASKPAKVQERITNARAKGRGETFLTQYVTNHPGVPLDEPIRTITTKSQWALVHGDQIRMLNVREHARAMGFPEDYKWPAGVSKDKQIKGLGNAICPPVAKWFTEQIMRAA